MGKLMKYEFRKTRLSRLILLLATAVSELLFLAGLFLKWNNGAIWGSFLLLACVTFGIFYIGVESILVFSKDMNTKQSYMLFMTPNNSYQILGAKVLENLICIIAAGLIFCLITFADISIATIQIDGLDTLMKNLNEILNSMFRNLPTWQEITAAFFEFLLGWFMTITIGYLTVILSATVLAGKRLSGLISFVLFIAISWIISIVLEYIPQLSNPTMNYALGWIVILVFSTLFYLISGWILEHKLSL